MFVTILLSVAWCENKWLIEVGGVIRGPVRERSGDLRPSNYEAINDENCAELPSVRCRV